MSGKVLTEVWAQTRAWELGQTLEAAGHVLSDVGKQREEQVTRPRSKHAWHVYRLVKGPIWLEQSG